MTQTRIEYSIKLCNIYPTYLGRTRPHQGRVGGQRAPSTSACRAAAGRDGRASDADGVRRSPADGGRCRRTSGSPTSAIRWN